MKLYTHAFSPNCRKVEAVVHELGIELERVHVDLLRGDHRSPAFLAKNPNGRVPVLEDGSLLLWESAAILRYLAHGSPLLPSERRAAAEVDRWLAWHTAHLSPAMRKVAFEKIIKKLAGAGQPDHAAIEAGTAEFHTLSRVLDARLAQRDYVAGPLSIADFALAAHYSLADACQLDLTAHPYVASWLTRMLGRPSVQHALALAKDAA